MPYASSCRISTTKFSFNRTAVSTSWEFIMNPRRHTPPSTRRYGYKIAAIIADGKPAPIVANALSNNNVFDIGAR